MPAGPIQRLDEVAADPERLGRGLFFRMPRSDAPDVAQVNTGVLVDGEANAPRTAPPGLAEHGRSVLHSLFGMSDGEIARLEDAGVVGRPGVARETGA